MRSLHAHVIVVLLIHPVPGGVTLPIGKEQGHSMPHNYACQDSRALLSQNEKGLPLPDRPSFLPHRFIV